ncbi:MAG TPA: hypothetical protein VGF44_02335 [Terriglobales bacterium]|jgi:hypothetical protein
MLLLLLGVAALAWSGYSVATGKGYYKGCPPGGYDRDEDPFNFWTPTIVIFALGIFVLLTFFGVIQFPHRPPH